MGKRWGMGVAVGWMGDVGGGWVDGEVSGVDGKWMREDGEIGLR